MIEPKPGAAERLAAAQVARLKPDGSVLYLMTGGQAVVSATDKTLSYDLLRDFDFIAIVTRFPFVFTVAPDSRFKTMEAYLDEARKEPGKLTYGTSGVGSTLHMAMELLLSKLDIRMTHVPYKGGIGAPYNDLVGGRLDMHVVHRPSPTPSRCSRPTSCAPWPSPRRIAIPASPTCRPSPRRSCRITTSCRGSASPRRPAAAGAARSLARGVRAGDGAAAVKDKLEELGNDTRVSTPAEFRARVEADMSRWRPLAHVVNQS